MKLDHLPCLTLSEAIENNKRAAKYLDTTSLQDVANVEKVGAQTREQSLMIEKETGSDKATCQNSQQTKTVAMSLEHAKISYDQLKIMLEPPKNVRRIVAPPGPITDEHIAVIQKALDSI